MYIIKKLNEISPLVKDIFGKNYEIDKDAHNPDAILVRSAVMHDYTIEPSLLAVARAGAGVNNIPLDKMAESGVVVFNTPGANANAVKELIITGMLLANRNIIDGINWTQQLKDDEESAKKVEAGKKAFIGPEIYGKTLAVIGLGAIGVLVANSAYQLGMKVIGYDPYLSEERACSLNPSIIVTDDLDALYQISDYITLNVPLNDSTRKMINAASIEKMKSGVRIVNAARSELVNNVDLIKALDSGIIAKYVTDFPNQEVIGKHHNIITIPHLGASTPEAEDNCAIMAAKQIKDYIENGNIVNSVNYPNMSSQKAGNFRITILAKENILHDAIASLSQYTIKGSLSGAKGIYNYFIIDTDIKPSADIIAALSKKALKVRVL